MNHSATMTSKGQLTIPVAIRKSMNLSPGDRVNFDDEIKGKVVLTKKTRSLDDLAGMLSEYKLDHPITREDIDAAIEQAMREKYFTR